MTDKWRKIDMANEQMIVLNLVLLVLIDIMKSL